MDDARDLYPAAQREAVRGSLRRRIATMAIWFLAWLGGSIAFIAMRQQLYAMIFSAVVGCVGIFVYFMKVEPIRCYHRFLRDMRDGMRRKVVATFESFDETISVRDGVEFTPMHLLEDGEDRLVYVDATLPRPDFHRGDALELVTFGNSLCAYRPAEGTPR